MVDLSSFSIIEYLEEVGVSYSTSGKNISQDWIGINCPFCDDQSNHLGINIHSKIYSCFRCGERGNAISLIKALENKDSSSAFQTVKQFTKKEKYGNDKIRSISMGSTKMVEQFIAGITEPLQGRDKYYLENRGFDPDSIGKNYGLLSCKPTSVYTGRILIPYIIQGKQYTFSTRDVTDKARIKYLHCPASRSIAAPKELLYNIDTVKDTCLVLEGVTDCFRMGAGSVALSGIQYTRNQLLVLSKFKRIFILFDPEIEAQKQAMNLAQDLSFCSGTVEIIKLDVDCDPGDMKEEDVRVLRREIFGRTY